MNKSGKVTLIAFLTVACGIGGYYVTDAILENNGGSNSVNVGGSSYINKDINTVEKNNTENNTEVTNKDEIEEPVKISGMGSDITPTITSVSKPVYNTSTKKYTFNVVAEGFDLKYVLTTYNGTVLKAQDSGLFSVDPVQNTGKYLVYVTDSSGAKSESKAVSGCVFVYEKLTAAQIQAAFNSGDYMEGDKLDFKNRIARNCTYSYTNLKENDEKPSSFSEIFNRIQLSSWKSITVNSVSYDQASNQATKINMTINY